MRLRRCFRSRALAHVQRDVVRRVRSISPAQSRKLDRKQCGVRSARPHAFQNRTHGHVVHWLVTLQAGEDQRSWSDPAPCGPLRRHAMLLSRPRTTAPDVVCSTKGRAPRSAREARRIRASPAASTRRGGYSSEWIENWYAQWCEMPDVARQDRQSVVLCRRRDDDVGYSRCLALSARPV